MISIIIPVYNQGEKIKRCLDSIPAQTYKDIEIIMVNDGSTDKTGEVIDSFKEKFKLAGLSYKIIEQENKGAPSARNRGRQIAKGDYLFCDADVILDKNCLAEMIDALKNHPEAAFAYCSFKWGYKLFKLQAFDGEKLKKTPYISTMSLVRAKNFPAAGWDERLKKLQDWDLWLTVSEQGGNGIWIDKPLFSACPGGTISDWLPAFAYKFFPFLPAVKKYKTAMRIVKEKHGLPFKP